MCARWTTFAVGMGLILAPLAVGYPAVGPALHDIALGLLACVLALAALETPALRFLFLLPAAWLLWTGQQATGLEATAGLVEMIGGGLLALGALAPRARLAPRLGARDRAGVRA